MSRRFESSSNRVNFQIPKDTKIYIVYSCQKVRCRCILSNYPRQNRVKIAYKSCSWTDNSKESKISREYQLKNELRLWKWGRGGVIRDPEGLPTTSPSLLPSLCPYPRGISNWFTRKQDCLIFLLVPWRHGWDSCLDAWLSRHVQSLVTWLNQRVAIRYFIIIISYKISKIFHIFFYSFWTKKKEMKREKSRKFL